MTHADPSRGRFATLRRAVGHPSLGGAAALGFALSASWSDLTFGVGLGPVTQQSGLGQSLRIVVPILVSPGEDIGADCFRLGASDREVDGVPQLAFGRMSLERTAEGARLVITNAAPVNDPVVRMTVQAGCDNAVRREYVLLMDPPPIETPVVAAESVRTEVAQAPEAPAAATPPRRARGSTRATTGAAAGETGEPARSARKPAPPPKARSSAQAQAKRPARVAGDSPRLTVSSAAPLTTPDARANPSSAERARAQQELANAMEAETVVLQRRIVELTAMVERMQEELRAAEAAQRTSAEAGKTPPAPAPEPAKAGAWSDQNWPLLTAIAALPLLAALGLLWRRRSQHEPAAEWPAPRVAAIPAATEAPATETALQGTPAGVVAAPAAAATEPAPPKRTPRRAPVARDSASALAVSELLHVTEEARVYVALGHPERAIDVLNEHVRQVPKSMPAAWLMLLDLYHASGRQQDFRRLAEEFHLHCNVQAPLWDSFGAGAYEEGGLETFPHILREVTRTWRQPGCREYLERLLYDNRDGRRMGFPLTAYGEILLLMQVLDAPPPVDIDRDLANDGKLDAIPKPAAASARPATLPRPAEAVRAARSGGEDAAQQPTQRPLDLESGSDGGTAAPAKKLSS
jgi:hypothetical protein